MAVVQYILNKKNNISGFFQHRPNNHILMAF